MIILSKLSEEMRRKLGLSRICLGLFTTTALLANWQIRAVASENPDLTAINSREVVVTEVEIPSLPALENPEHYLSIEEDIHLVINLSERRVYLYQGDRAITSYPIAIGRKGWETPTGDFQVIQLFSQPSWKHPFTGKIIPPGPENPLGDRWIGFWTDGKNYIGFHGTPAEHLIGQAVSHGCVRMRNQDVRVLFEQVAIGTPVIVKP